MFDPSEVITHEDTKILARFFQSPITVASFRHSGLSRQGIAIKAKGQTFFIKQFDSELDESMLLEKRLSKLTSIKALSPKLVGHIERYLIYEYVDHTILGELTLSLEEKIGVTCKVLTQFQQAIRIELPKLDVKKATLDLLAQCSLHDKTVELIIEYIESLVLPVSNKLDVICHGDLNFANIIKPVGLDDVQIAKSSSKLIQNEDFLLIDFESCCFAHPAFDIAMSIAINRLYDEMELNKVIGLFLEKLQEHKGNQLDFSIGVVMRYLPYCFLINGLWYFSKAVQLNSRKHMNLSIEQFHGLKKCVDCENNLLNKMRQEANKSRLTTMRETR